MQSELPLVQEMCRSLSANSVLRLWHAEQEVSVFPGVITTTQSFDREKQREYMLSVTATDQAQEPLIGVCQITVLIADVNDNDPKFENSRYQCECFLTTCPSTATWTWLVVPYNSGQFFRWPVFLCCPLSQLPLNPSSVEICRIDQFSLFIAILLKTLTVFTPTDKADLVPSLCSFSLPSFSAYWIFTWCPKTKHDILARNSATLSRRAIVICVSLTQHLCSNRLEWYLSLVKQPEILGF